MYCKFSTFEFSNPISNNKSIVLDIFDDDLCCYVIATCKKGFYEIKYTVRSSYEQTYVDFLIKEQLVTIEYFNKNTKFYRLKLTPKALLNVL